MRRHSLHDHAASAALLWRVRVLAFWNDTPDRRDHVVSCAVAVCDDTLGSLADGNPLPLKILTQPVVKLGQAAKLKVSHALLVLLNLRWVANVSGCVLGHFEGGLEYLGGIFGVEFEKRTM